MSNDTERGESFMGDGLPESMAGESLSERTYRGRATHGHGRTTAPSSRDGDRWHLLQGEGREGARSLVSRPTRDPHRGLHGRLRVAGREERPTERPHDLGPVPRQDTVLREERRILH